MLGDVLRLDLSTMAWSAPPTTGAPPPRRTGHAAAGAGGALYVVGGRDGTGESATRIRRLGYGMTRMRDDSDTA